MQTLGIDFPFMVAPMVGISHVAFRELVRLYTPPEIKLLRFTEMLSTRRLPSERLDSSEELRTAREEAFFVPQLLGNERKFIEPSIKKISQLSPWGIDINMGCPQTHILRHNWGVRLMGDPVYAAEVVRMVKESTTLPVSVKLRGGGQDDIDLEYLLSFTEALENAGADWLIVHARPRSAKHTGLANWDAVRVLTTHRKIPVVANGDIQTADDALNVIQQFKCDGAMVARAATVRPWIFWQIAKRLDLDVTKPFAAESHEPPQSGLEEAKEYFRAFALYIDLLLNFFGEGDFSLQKARFFAATGSRWFKFGHSFWKLTMKSKTLVEMKNAAATYAAASTDMMAGRIDL